MRTRERVVVRQRKEGFKVSMQIGGDSEEEVKHSWEEINLEIKGKGHTEVGKEDAKNKDDGGKEVGAHRQNKISVTRPHKAPDEERGPDKTCVDTVAMVSLTRDKDGEVFGAESEASSDLEREAEKHEPAGEATYTRDKSGAGLRLDKTCVVRQEKYSETEPAKAPEEALDSETVQQQQQQFQQPGQQERL